MSSHHLNNVVNGTRYAVMGDRMFLKRELSEPFNVDDMLDPLPGFVFSVSLNNLIQRYEEPSSMVRWDSPLFTIPWTDPDVPADDIWRAVTQGLVKPPNTGTQAVRVAHPFTLHADP